MSVDPSLLDQRGNMRPIISYSIPDYTLRGIAYARQPPAALCYRSATKILDQLQAETSSA